MQCLATFETTHMALKFEKKCREHGLEVRISPVPRELSSSCGFACSYPCDARKDVDKIAQDEHVEIAGHHEL